MLDAKFAIQDDVLVLKVKYMGRPGFEFKAQNKSITIKGVKSMSIKAGQSVTLSIHPHDAYGNTAKLDGIPAWVSSDESIITLAVADDGLSVVATSVGPVGTSAISVSADADLDTPVKLLTGSVSVDVEAGEAVDLAEAIEPIVVHLTPAAPVEASAVEAPAEEAAPAEPAVTDAPPADEAPAA